MANTNDYLVYGWSAQQNGATAGQSGYAQPATVPATANVSAAEQVSSGYPNPPGAMNIGSESSGSYSSEILTNPGYASGNGTVLGQITPPAVPASTVAAQNPSGLASVVTLSGGTITAVYVAPLVAGVAGTYVEVATGDAAGSPQIVVPGGGFIKVTYSVAPTWTWFTTN